MWMGKPRCFRKHHNKGKRKDHTHVPYELLDSIDGRVRAEEEAEVAREVDRQKRRQVAAEEFLRHCEELKAAERAEQKRIDEAAEELLQEQLKGESRGRRYKTIRWVLDSVAKILPPSLRRSLSPIRDRFAPPERRLTYAELRDGRGETKRKHTLAKNVTADNLWASASTRGRPR